MGNNFSKKEQDAPQDKEIKWENSAELVRKARIQKMEQSLQEDQEKKKIQDNKSVDKQQSQSESEKNKMDDISQTQQEENENDQIQIKSVVQKLQKYIWCKREQQEQEQQEQKQKQSLETVEKKIKQKEEIIPTIDQTKIQQESESIKQTSEIKEKCQVPKKEMKKEDKSKSEPVIQPQEKLKQEGESQKEIPNRSQDILKIEKNKKEQDRQEQQQQEEESKQQTEKQQVDPNMPLDEYIRLLEGNKPEQQVLKNPEEQKHDYFAEVLQFSKREMIKMKEKSLQLTNSNIEDSLYERLNLSSDKLFFLIKALRISYELGKNLEDFKQEIVTIVQDYIVTYLLYPDTLQEQNVNQPLNEEKFVKEIIQIGKTIRTDLFKHIETNHKDEIEKIIRIVLKQCLILLQKASIKNTTPYSQVFELLESILLKNQGCLEVFLKSEYFYLENCLYGRLMQEGTIVGKLLSISSLPQESNLNKEEFQINSQRGLISANMKIKTYQQRITQHNERVYLFLNEICKHKEFQPYVIKFFNKILDLNRDRIKTYYNPDPIKNCTESILLNLEQVLLRFSFNIVKDKLKYEQKAERLDYELFVKREGFFQDLDQISQKEGQEEELNQEDKIEQKGGDSSSQHNKNEFITQIIKITLGFLYSNNSFLEMLDQIHAQISRLHAQNQQNQKYYQLYSYLYLSDIMIKDPEIAQLKMHFLSFAVYIYLYFNNNAEFYCISKKHDNIQNKINQTEKYMKLYQFLLEVINKNIRSYCLDNPKEVLACQSSVIHIVQFCMLAMGSKKLCFGPHQRCLMLEIVSYFVPSSSHGRRQNNLSFAFSKSQIVDNFLIQSLLNAFITAEKTGTHAQFYDKFQYRSGFNKIITYLFSNQKGTRFQNQFMELAQKNKKVFLEFANLYLNDINFFFDDIINQTQEVKKLMEEVKQMPEGEDKTQKKATIDQKISIAASCNQWLNPYLSNLVLFSSFSQETFLAEEIRDKMVNNCDFIVQQLADEHYFKQINIVELQSKIKLEPTKLLRLIIQLYGNFREYESFQKQIVEDKRCFNYDLFFNCFQKLRTTGQLQKQHSQNFLQLLESLKILQTEDEQNEKLFEGVDIPEEFQDLLTYEIMNDPVKLETSGNIVDLLTIKKQLLNDPLDPFNRAPLDESQLIPQPELKQKIQDFKNELKKKKIQQIKEQTQLEQQKLAEEQEIHIEEEEEQELESEEQQNLEE